jgi:holo-ACP synthase
LYIPSGKREEEYLRRLLAGRDERAYIQNFLLGIGGVSGVLQISINMPGLPKNVPGDAEALSLFGGIFWGALPERPASKIFMANYAGKALVFSFKADASRVKSFAVEIEDGYEWGRAIDADVVTKNGPISRSSLGKNQRKCLLCGESAKICARTAKHDVSDLRSEVFRLLSLAR